MKKYVLLLLYSILTTVILPNTVTAQSKRLKAQLSYNTFYSPADGPYLETYLAVTGNSVYYKQQANGKFIANIEIKVTFKQDSAIKFFDKYNLISPESDSSENITFNFLDQQRYPLANGTYQFELSIADLNAAEKIPFLVTQPIKLGYYPHIVAISDIQLIESYSKAEPGKESVITKCGYNLVPFVDNYYPQSKDKISFYAEIYNTSKVTDGGVYLLNYYIETYEQKRILENFRGFSKRGASEVGVLLSEFPIESLPSGNYNLVVEVRSNKNEILAFKECSFIRFSPLADEQKAGELEKVNIENTFVTALTNTDTLAEFIS